jgi:hypothetical protein
MGLFRRVALRKILREQADTDSRAQCKFPFGLIWGRKNARQGPAAAVAFRLQRRQATV